MAAAVVCVVVLMVVPLPTWLMDLLIAGNLAVSCAILLTTLYVTSALHIATFPTILLITTLFRLGLNIASTRLILLQANAGEVIRAFGGYVVRGNYAVGAVVFLLLTIVQFLVIARGGERVAEVGARFTLDAMPGKQMAIDADLRSGQLDPRQATARRRELERESQFYGAMDGAMKFVKGDAIAAMLITVVNLIGGLAVGMGQRHMELGLALKRYGLLTIGDGLVSQIPSLVLATAAGVLVTRVDSDQPDRSVGEDVVRHVFGSPRALGIAAAFVVVLALVPGLPAPPFVAVGLALFLLSVLHRSRRRAQPIRPQGDDALGLDSPPLLEPWSLAIGAGLGSLMRPGLRGAPLGPDGAPAALRQGLHDQLGVVLPPCRVWVDPQLDSRSAVLILRQVPEVRLEVSPEVEPSAVEQLLVERMLPHLGRRAASLLGIAETQALLDRLEAVSPATVRQLVPKPLSLTTLTEVLRCLLDEGISIRDLKSILEALATVAPSQRDPGELAEIVRRAFRRVLSHELTAGTGRLDIVVLDPSVEDVLRGAITRTSEGAFLSLAPNAAKDVIAAVRRALGELPTKLLSPAVLMVSPETRRFVRSLLRAELPDLRVISHTDLAPDVSLKAHATATVSGL